MWINTALTPPTKQWFWGATPPSPGTGVAANAGAWHSDNGTRTFVQDADPTTPTGGSATPVEGDLWTTIAAPVQTRVWHTTPAGPGNVPPAVSAWIATVASVAPPSTIPTAQFIFDAALNSWQGGQELGFGMVSSRSLGGRFMYEITLVRPTNTYGVAMTQLANNDQFFSGVANAISIAWISTTQFKIWGFLPGVGNNDLGKVSFIIY
jgi:hypothetical protein